MKTNTKLIPNIMFVRQALLLITMMTMWQVGWGIPKKNVASNLYDATIVKNNKDFGVTDSYRSNNPNTSFYYTDEAGFTYILRLTDNVWSAEIYKLPDTETITIPTKIQWKDIEVPVTVLSFTRCGDNVKDIYFNDLLPTSFNGKNVTVHASDSQLDKILSEFSVKAVITDNNKALSRDFFEYNLPWANSNVTPKILFDVDGDGRLDLLSLTGRRTSENQARAIILGKSIDGKISYMSPSTQTTPYNPCSSGFFSILSNDGKPYWVTHNGLVYNMSGDLVLNRGKDSYIMFAATADINGNGCKEIIGNIGNGSDGYYNIIRMLPDGTFADDKIYITSDTTAVNSIDNYTPNSGVITKNIGGIRGLGEGMFVKDLPSKTLQHIEAEVFHPTEATASTETNENATLRKHLVKEGNQLKVMSLPNGILSASDYNGDGLTDLNDGNNIYYNLGGNRFFRSPHKGTVYATDLTGNGMLDFIDFNNNQTDLYISKADGSMGEPKTLLKNSAVQNVFFGDFDHDGDVDILFVIKGSDFTLFQFYRNDGNGVFRAKDDNIDGLYTPIECNDYDGDGQYEILTKYYNSNIYYTYHLFKISKNWSVTKTDLPEYFVTAGDIDNDGIMDMLSINIDTKWGGNINAMGKYTLINKLPGAVKNTRPEKMQKPSAATFADANKLKISWTQGKDNETSACDLTYELRIGTASGKGDIYYGNANADGTRRVIADGNMGRALSYMYDTGNLNEGKYYIAIQAVDASGLGGEWSDELVYDHKLSAPVITSMAGGCTADTITLSVQNPITAAAYEWTIDKGEIIDQNSNSSVIKVVFKEAGKHTFNVSMTLNGSTVKSANETIVLTPSKYNPLITSDDKPLYTKYLIDIDQDGKAEIVNSKELTYSSHVLYEQKSEGTFSPIRKTWNTDIDGYLLISDFNRDGYPDLLTFGGSDGKGKVYYNSGENDKTFDTEEIEIKGYNSQKKLPYIIDWNNDGRFAIYGSMIDKDGSFNYETQKINEDNYSGYKLADSYDFNRDGNMDIWKTSTDYTALMDQTKVRLKVAGGDMVYDTEEKLYYQNKHSYVMDGFADFNNDGNADGYFFDNGFMVIVKGKPMSEWPCTETIALPLEIKSYDSINLLDVDNNGYLDIIYNNNVWLMDKDFKYTKMKLESKTNYYDEYHWQPISPNSYPNGLASNIVNEAPSVPANVTAQNTAAGLLLKWDDATDDHTPWAQMRYNVSLKEKGKTGTGAFVLSPMNGLSDEAAILTGVRYRKATQLTVPASALTEGTTYEVQIQAIDLMGEHSAMSKPVEIVFHKENYIAINAEKLYNGFDYEISYNGNHTAKIKCSADNDAKVTETDSSKGTFNIKWSTPGIKTITMTDGNNTVSLKVNVLACPSFSIPLPKTTMLNSPLTISIPNTFASSAVEDVKFLADENYSVSYNYGDSIATFLFTKPGKVVVKAQGTIAGLPEKCVEQSTTNVVEQVMPTAIITSVEGEGRHYRVNWQSNVPSMVSQVEIARETNRLDQYEVLDVIPVADATWCDLSSDNRIQPHRYRIRLLADNGVQTSDWSEAHNPLHVDINKTVDGQGNNLMWNAYEGLDVESYVILRGTSANKLQTIATVPATQLSYTDNDVPDGTCYYAVRFNKVSTMARGKMRVQQFDEKVQSNIISSEDALPTIAATNISIVAVEKNMAFTNEQPQIHLTAVVLPIYATYNKVGWAIVSGNEYATIASNGVVSATGGKGDIVVRATTLDGSNLSTEITIACDYSVLAKSVGIFNPKASIKVNESIQLEAIILPRNVSMKDVVWTSLDKQVATVDASGVVRGITPGSTVITATTADGTNLIASTRLEVINPTGIHHISTNDDTEIQYFTLDGIKIEKPIKGQVYITNKGYKVMYK